MENELSKKADSVLICDTDLLETKVYSQEYYGGYVDPRLDEAAQTNTYDLYLLTYIDTPWEADDLRDRPELRLEMFQAFENALKTHGKKYIILKGSRKKRFNKAMKAIDMVIASRKDLYRYPNQQ